MDHILNELEIVDLGDAKDLTEGLMGPDLEEDSPLFGYRTE